MKEENYFDLVSILKDTHKKISDDIIKLQARKEMVDEIINFITMNNLKIIKDTSSEIKQEEN